VTNSGGALSAPLNKTITVLGTPPGCAANGDVLIQATPGQFNGTEGQDIGNGTDVIQWGSIGEPANMPGELVFTIKVNNLTTVQPGFRWMFFFNVAGRPAPNTGYYYVAMVSADGPTPVFNYGYRTVNAAGFGQFQVLGWLNAASTFNPDGTITLVLDKSAFALATGNQLTHLDVETRTSAADDLTGTTSAGVGLTQESAGAAVPYTLVGNSTCAANAAPVAHLAASPTTGTAPLAVTLTGSTSTPSNGASIAYYRFTFGDGTSTAWQTSATAQHTYSAAGAYTASLQVADNRGLISGSASTVTITVKAAPVKAAMSTPTPGSTLTGSSQTLTWSAGTSVSSYQLWVGTTVGGKDIYAGTASTAKSATVTKIPALGKTVYVRLWSYINAAWQYNDYTYVEAKP
jgi:PKD repeat protein